MYEEHFSLSGAPFKLNPDPKFFFGSRSHNKAMAYLHYGLKQAEGFIVITGPIGSGKTMVISQLLDQLTSSNVVAAQLLTSNIAPEELLDHMLSAFRIEPEGEGRTGKLEAFEDYLFDQLNRGRRVLLIMDEAQNLPFETLEELRMLSNLDYDGTPLFQVFLVGQPEFREVLQSQRLEQLRQRVIASYHLENLSVEETKEYIHHRLSITGWREDPKFSDGAIEAIFTETGGRPRRINTVCNRIMLFCSIEDEHEVTAEIAKSVIAELHDEELDARDVAAPGDRMLAVTSVAEPADPIETSKDADTPSTASDDEIVAQERPLADGNDDDAPEASDAPDASEASETSDDDDDVAEENAATVADVAEEDNEMSEDRPDDATPSPKEAPNEHEKAAAKAPDEPEQSIAPDDDATPDAEDDTPSAETEAEPAPVLKVKPTGDGSVLDRIRAKRSVAPDDAPSEATLEDVATAIAKASAGEPAAKIMSDNEADDASALIAPLKSVQSTEWRRQVRHSIDETRGELKEAHASVRRLKKSLSELQRQRRDRREEIVAGIVRAETLLNEVRKGLS